MRIAFITEYNCTDPDVRSGVPYHIYKGFLANGHQVDMILVKDVRNIIDKLISRCYQFYYHTLLQFKRGLYNVYWSKTLSKAYAKSIINTDFSKYDFAITISTITCAYANINCNLTVWIDNTFESFYSNGFNNVPTIKMQNESNEIDDLVFKKAKKVFVASGWLRDKILKQYQLDALKILVLPRGASMSSKMDYIEIEGKINQKIKENVCNILFICSGWEYKGGEIVIKTFRELQKKISCTLKIIGNISPKSETDFKENHISYLGYINKSSKDAFEKYSYLFNESFLLFVPSRADGFGIVYAEAASFGVPSLAYAIMGITESVQQNVTGILLPETENEHDFVASILELWNDKKKYKKLCLSAFEYAEKNFDWGKNTQKIALNFL